MTAYLNFFPLAPSMFYNIFAWTCTEIKNFEWPTLHLGLFFVFNFFTFPIFPFLTFWNSDWPSTVQKFLRKHTIKMGNFYHGVAKCSCRKFCCKFLSILCISQLITELIQVSLERSFLPAEFEYRWCQFWLKVMMSELEQKPIGLITVFNAILTGRQSSQKLQCLYGNPIAIHNRIFHNLWIKTLKYLVENCIH